MLIINAKAKIKTKCLPDLYVIEKKFKHTPPLGAGKGRMDFN